MNSMIMELVSAFRGISNVLSIPCIIIGALICFFGYKIFRIMCGVKGFFAGAILGAILGLLSQDGGTTVICALIGGIIGAVLAYAAYLISVFLSCFVTGVLLGTVLMIASRNYSGIVLGAVMCGLLFGVLGVLLTKTLIILQTAIEGALWIGIGFSLLTYNVVVAMGAIVVFFVLGLVIQSRNGGGKATDLPPQAGQENIIVPETIAPVPQETAQSVVQGATQNVTQSVVQGATQNVTQSVVQGVIQNVAQKVQSTPQEVTQSEPHDIKKDIQDMAQNAQRVTRETASTLWKMLKTAKDGSGKFIDIAAEQGKKAEAMIEKGILLLQKSVENIWGYFENNKKLFFPIMCVALVVASVIAIIK